MTWNILNLNTKPIAGDTPEDFSLNAIVQFFLFDISPTMVNPLYWLKWHSVEPGQILIYLGSQNLSSDKNLTQCLQNLNSRKTNSIAGIISSVERERKKCPDEGHELKLLFDCRKICVVKVFGLFFLLSTIVMWEKYAKWIPDDCGIHPGLLRRYISHSTTLAFLLKRVLCRDSAGHQR